LTVTAIAPRPVRPAHATTAAKSLQRRAAASRMPTTALGFRQDQKRLAQAKLLLSMSDTDSLDQIGMASD